MKAGIIAAGKGERLLSGGISGPKPLLPVGGQPLIARAIRAAARLNVESIACIVNDLKPEVADYLRAGSWPVSLEVVVKTTPNSMESLFALAPCLEREPFFLFTVDSIFAHGTLERFAARSLKFEGARGVLALTTYVEDERPLWVRLGRRQQIVSIGEAAAPARFVTAGFYYFTPKIFEFVGAARAREMTALRQFLGFLLEKGFLLFGVPVSKTIDVDHPQDVEKAEAYLKMVEGDG